MTRKQSRGVCNYCNKELSKSGITKHLGSCAQRQVAIAKANENSKGKLEVLYHLRIQDAYSKDFWLDLEMRGSKSLRDLDHYLRAIWLECCGHLSEFFLGGSFEREVAMSRQISALFPNGIGGDLTHIYDMGTSSETIVKCAAVREGKPLTSKPIALMARNLMPEISCIQCGKPATYFCPECQIEDQTEGTLCDEHTENHPHDNYGEPLPLVNSPRMGLCGYEGPAEPPY